MRFYGLSAQVAVPETTYAGACVLLPVCERQREHPIVGVMPQRRSFARGRIPRPIATPLL